LVFHKLFLPPELHPKSPIVRDNCNLPERRFLRFPHKSSPRFHPPNLQLPPSWKVVIHKLSALPLRVCTPNSIRIQNPKSRWQPKRKFRLKNVLRPYLDGNSRAFLPKLPNARKPRVV